MQGTGSHLPCGLTKSWVPGFQLLANCCWSSALIQCTDSVVTTASPWRNAFFLLPEREEV